MANKRLIDANALWRVFGEEAEKIEMGVKNHRKLATSKLLIHWCMEQAAKAPTVDAVEVVHGRWEWYEALVNPYALCSNCGCGLDKRDALHFDYCPFCGAKMDGGNEE